MKKLSIERLEELNLLDGYRADAEEAAEFFRDLMWDIPAEGEIYSSDRQTQPWHNGLFWYIYDEGGSIEVHCWQSEKRSDGSFEFGIEEIIILDKKNKELMEYKNSFHLNHKIN